MSSMLYNTVVEEPSFTIFCFFVFFKYRYTAAAVCTSVLPLSIKKVLPTDLLESCNYDM